MMRKKRNNQMGFTLTETLVVSSISLAVGMVFLTIMDTGQKQMQAAEGLITLQDQAREGIYKLNQELRQSNPASLSVLLGGNAVQFRLPDSSAPITPGGTINWDSDVIQYAVVNNQLVRSNLTANTSTVAANYVSSVNFTKVSSDRIRTTLQIQNTLLDGRTVQTSLSGQADIRNAGAGGTGTSGGTGSGGDGGTDGGGR